MLLVEQQEWHAACKNWLQQCSQRFSLGYPAVVILFLLEMTTGTQPNLDYFRKVGWLNKKQKIVVLEEEELLCLSVCISLTLMSLKCCWL